MKTVQSMIPNTLMPNATVVAEVTALRADADIAIVTLREKALPNSMASTNIVANITPELKQKLSTGDVVMCVSDSAGKVYVFALLEQKNCTTESLAKNKTHIIRAEKEDAEILQVYNNQNQLIFEYDRVTERSTVNVNSGDLAIDVVNGDLNFSAAGKIILDGKEIELSALDNLGNAVSSLNLRQFTASLQTKLLNIESVRGMLKIDEAKVLSNQLTSSIASAKLQWGKIETVADSVFQKMRRHFSEVEDVWQTKAGRMRMLAKGTFRLKAERTKIKADKSVNIDGERINLG